MEEAVKLSLKKSTNVRTAIRRQELSERALRLGFCAIGPLAPGLAAAVAEQLFFRAQRYPAPKREEQILATGHRFWFECDGEQGRVKLACWSWGDGPTVFLLHGWSGRAGQLGEFVEPLVQAGFSVIAFDAPAHGFSTGETTSAPAFARALMALVARFGPAHAVVGHSMGGWSAAFALLGGAHVGRVALIGSPVDPGAFTGAFAKRLGLSSRVVARLKARAERRTKMRFEELDLSRKMGSVVTPALIVHDEDDKDVGLADANAWVAAWPGARLHVTRGLGHTRILRDEPVIRQVVEFVKGS